MSNGEGIKTGVVSTIASTAILPVVAHPSGDAAT